MPGLLSAHRRIGRKGGAYGGGADSTGGAAACQHTKASRKGSAGLGRRALLPIVWTYLVDGAGVSDRASLKFCDRLAEPGARSERVENVPTLQAMVLAFGSKYSI